MQPKGESKGGKGKRGAGEVQRLPLFMSAGRSRVNEQVVMSATLASEKRRYLRWAAAAARLTREEAEVMLLDRALGDFMKRDEGWQIEKAALGNAGTADGVDEPAPQAAQPGSPAEGAQRASSAAAPAVLK